MIDQDSRVPNFKRFDLAEPLLDAVTELGFSEPTRVQQCAIPEILQGKNLLVSAETGSGKTLAYLLPLLQILLYNPNAIGTQALILVPTRELAQQIFFLCQQLAQFTDLTISLVMGGEDYRKQQNTLRRSADILIATPGRLLEHLNQGTGNFRQLALMVLDESDRMLDMGFSDAVLGIADACNPKRQTVLFSATLSHYDVVKVADRVLVQYHTIALNHHHDPHPNITQYCVLADDYGHKLNLVAWLLAHESHDKALIFANTRLRAVDIET